MPKKRNKPLNIKKLFLAWVGALVVGLAAGLFAYYFFYSVDHNTQPIAVLKALLLGGIGSGIGFAIGIIPHLMGNGDVNDAMLRTNVEQIARNTSTKY
jgi:hypothetical protein